MGDDRAGPASALIYFASGLDADGLPEGDVRDAIRERATAVLVTIGMSEGGTASPRSDVPPTWFVDLWIVPPGPLDVLAKGTFQAGERGALLVVDPDGEDVVLMPKAEVVQVGDPGRLMKVRIESISSETADGCGDRPAAPGPS